MSAAQIIKHLYKPDLKNNLSIGKRISYIFLLLAHKF